MAHPGNSPFQMVCCVARALAASKSTLIPFLLKLRLMFFLQIILQIMSLSLPGDRVQLEHLVASARPLLHEIRASPSPVPESTSPAVRAFDPLVTRHLHSFVPLRPLELPSQESAWNAVEALIDGYEDIIQLAKEEVVCTWQVTTFRSVDEQKCSLSFLDRRPSKIVAASLRATDTVFAVIDTS
jgi:hypothetical protein